MHSIFLHPRASTSTERYTTERSFGFERCIHSSAARISLASRALRNRTAIRRKVLLDCGEPSNQEGAKVIHFARHTSRSMLDIDFALSLAANPTDWLSTPLDCPMFEHERPLPRGRRVRVDTRVHKTDASAFVFVRREPSFNAGGV